MLPCSTAILPMSSCSRIQAGRGTFLRMVSSPRLTFGLLAIVWMFFLPCEPASAQSPSLTLSSVTANPGSTVVLSVSFVAGAIATAGLQWTISYPAYQIARISATNGPASAAAGKSISCASTADSLTCLVTGANSSGIGSGIVANVQVTLAASAGAMPINISNPVGVDATGAAIPSIKSTRGNVFVPSVSNTAGAIAAGQQGVVSASFGSSSQPRFHGITCSLSQLRAAGQAVCEIHLEALSLYRPTMIQLQSSSPSLLTPAAITVHPRQSAASFRIEAASHGDDSSATITARIDDDTVNQTVNIDSATPSLTLPSHVYGRPARSLRFRVTSAIPGAVLSASDLPPGAVFDAASGDFEWTPGVSQRGAHRVGFTATGRAGDPVTAQSLVEIESGSPTISRLVNAATRSEDAVCSPGAIARIEGRWLFEDSSMSGGSSSRVPRESTIVRVNGSEAPLLSS